MNLGKRQRQYQWQQNILRRFKFVEGWEGSSKDGFEVWGTTSTRKSNIDEQTRKIISQKSCLFEALAENNFWYTVLFEYLFTITQKRIVIFIAQGSKQ